MNPSHTGPRPVPHPPSDPESHLDQESLVSLARAGYDHIPAPDVPPEPDPAREADRVHLAGCRRCQAEVAAWQAVARAARSAEDPVVVPGFAALVAPVLVARGVLAAQAPSPPVSPARPGLRRAARLALLVVARQASVLARTVGLLTVLGSAAAVLLAVRVPPSVAVRAFTSVTCLVALLGALAICVPARDPRREVFAALPVSPSSVVLARTVLVLGIDLVLAAAGSVVVAGRAGTGLVSVVITWLGPCVLASGAALLLSVWRSPGLGAVVGGVLWLTGTLATSAGSVPVAVPTWSPGWLLAELWSTSALSLTLAATMLLGAILLTGRAARRDLVHG